MKKFSAFEVCFPASYAGTRQVDKAFERSAQVVGSLLKNREMGLTPRSQSGLTLCESVMLLAAAVFVLTTETVVLVELVRV